MVDCSWKHEFGVDCLTCGFQRSVHLLFHGEFVESFLMFPATIPFITTLIIAAVHIFRGLKHGPGLIVATFSLTALLIVVNYVVKVSNGSFIS